MEDIFNKKNPDVKILRRNPIRYVVRSNDRLKGSLLSFDLGYMSKSGVASPEWLEQTSKEAKVKSFRLCLSLFASGSIVIVVLVRRSISIACLCCGIENTGFSRFCFFFRS